jgi:hypothetical protein
MYLQDCELIRQEIEYGHLGTYGNLGYSIIPSVNSIYYNNIISAHPASILEFKIPESKYFSCKLALNDSSNDQASANYEIYADDILMHYSKNVKKKELIEVFFKITNCKKITLKCTYNNNPICHALYIDAILHEESPEYFLDSMSLTKIKNISDKADLVVASFIDKNYIPYAENLSNQIRNSTQEIIKFVFFCPEKNDELIEFCKSQSALLVPIQDKNYQDISSKGSHAIYSKGASFSIAKIIDAEKYLILDQDMILCDKFDLLLEQIKQAKDGQILICKDAHTEGITFGEVISSSWSAYEGSEKCQNILNLTPEEFQNELVINSGVIGGDKKALLALDDSMRRILPNSLFYLEENSNNTMREQSLVNLALIRYGNYKEIHKKFNLQIIWEEYELDIKQGVIKCKSLDFNPVFMHFNGKEAKKLLNSSINAIQNKNDFQNSKYSIAKDLCKNIEDELNILDLQNDDVILKSFQIHLENCNTYKLYNSKLIKNNIEETIKDEFLYLLSLQDSKSKFDFIIISNMESEINIARKLMICKNLLSENGRIIFKQYHTSEYTFENIQNKNIDLEELSLLFEYERNSTEQTLLIK